MAELDQTVKEISAGDYDGHLDALSEAIIDRVRSGAVDFAWRIRFDGDEWSRQDVTLGELIYAEKLTGTRMRVELDPRVDDLHALALIIAHLHKAQGVAAEDAVKRAEAITAAELAEIVGEFEVRANPKDGSARETNS
jgi:hypothetical protein